MAQGTIVKVAGPLIMATGMADARMYEHKQQLKQRGSRSR